MRSIMATPIFKQWPCTIYDIDWTTKVMKTPFSNKQSTCDFLSLLIKEITPWQSTYAHL